MMPDRSDPDAYLDLPPFLDPRGELKPKPAPPTCGRKGGNCQCQTIEECHDRPTN